MIGSTSCSMSHTTRAVSVSPTTPSLATTHHTQPIPGLLPSGHLCPPSSASLAARQLPPGPHQLGCPPPLHAQTLARGPLATVQLHPAVYSGTARAAVRRRRWLCCERGRTPAASRRLPGQQQLQAPPTATQPPSFGIQAKSGVPLGVFQLSGPAGPAAPQVRHPYPVLCHGAAHQELGALQGPASVLRPARASRNSASFTSLRNTRPQSRTPPCA